MLWDYLRSNPDAQERCQGVPPDPIVLENETGKKWHDMVKAGDGYNAFIEWLRADNMNGNKSNVDGWASPPLAGIEAPWLSFAIQLSQRRLWP